MMSKCFLDEKNLHNILMFKNIEVNSHKIKASLSYKQQQNALIAFFTAILTSLNSSKERDSNLI